MTLDEFLDRAYREAANSMANQKKDEACFAIIKNFILEAARKQNVEVDISEIDHYMEIKHNSKKCKSSLDSCQSGQTL